MPTFLEFDSQHKLKVDEDLNQVEGQLRRAAPGIAGLVQFAVDGKKVFVNAALVRVTKDAPTHRTASFQ